MSSYHLRLPSSIDACRPLFEFVMMMSDQERFDSCFASELALVVKEAFVNAVIHGNRECPHCFVHLAFSVEQVRGRKVLYADISDEGEGFFLHEVPDPRLSFRLMEPSGRGLLFISSYAEITGLRKDCNGSTLSLLLYPY
ncbi:ATP-binding protein [Prosthecochloris sp. HL-130-GSB]|jgi:serine/threonine-protein kinase RsbW|uniref:ATP-binding protein n=1 Tax=Prosthecochloris sp. HL-130-GSB TaxID=1974213 RepID=UPI000A1BFF5F|nr:ATP-binding protein [Prosthecochloris sp. HL-130-GSB]ARM30765.1 hypothetical protein B9H02_04905 [Prosthecochloris sp. HL-130-GSB]MBO8093137.1 ATP-binding protein [Prosthecochloris sp.]